MARRKMYKTLNTALFEDLGDTGGWSALVDFAKQQASLGAAYIDKVRISFILEGDSGTTSRNLGYLFMVSNKETLSATDANNTPYIIGASASRGGGGSVTIPIKRVIRDNDFDENSGQNKLRLFARMTDTGSEDYSITCLIETWGRWHQVNAV